MHEPSSPPATLRCDTQPPLDIETMRATARALLTQDATLPRHDDLQTALLLLRGHLALIVPETEALARSLPDEHTARSPALATVAHTRVHLDTSPGHGLVSATEHAKSLARDLRDLCDHYETLTSTAQAEQPV